MSSTPGAVWLAHERHEAERAEPIATSERGGDPVESPARYPLLERLSLSSLAALAEAADCSVRELVEHAEIH